MGPPTNSSIAGEWVLESVNGARLPWSYEGANLVEEVLTLQPGVDDNYYGREGKYGQCTASWTWRIGSTGPSQKTSGFDCQWFMIAPSTASTSSAEFHLWDGSSNYGAGTVGGNTLTIRRHRLLDERLLIANEPVFVYRKR